MYAPNAPSPPGIDYRIVYDTAPFINESVNEVFETLFDAIVLVALVVLVFLQNWRSTLIPLIAVPVAVIGTFAVLAIMGFSLNNLTLFGLVLAIGIVVDDAIVVVEAVEHHIERGLSPRDATIKAMDEVSGPVIAIGLVLAAVFVPCAFISGIVGGLLRVSTMVLVVYAGLLGLTYWGFISTPTGFIPSQDMGYLLANVQLPDSASTERTQKVMNKIERITRNTEGVRFTQTM